MILEEELGQILKENNLTISTAESCTGGLVSSRLTDMPMKQKILFLVLIGIY